MPEITSEIAPEITGADRAAAQALRIVLADLSGFWFKADDDSALCAALARHRIETEQRLGRSLKPIDDRIFGPKLELLARPGLLLRGPSAANADGTSAAA